MHLICRSALLITCLIGLGGPGCASETEETTAVDPSVAAVEVGPDGGELVGTEENGFAGVKLVIPPGALSDTITVSFEDTLDETPLPALAENVGRHVRILPEGTKLAKPAQLTLPTDRLLRMAFENPDDDCKVWAREGEGWVKKEPIATDEAGLTVEISAFTTAQAGVHLTPKLPSCFPDCMLGPIVEPEAPCVSSVGYCVTPVRQPSISFPPSIHNSATVVGDQLYYVMVFGAEVAAVKFSIYGDSDSVKFNSFRPPSFTFRRVDVTAAGSVWAPSAAGTVKFRTDALPQVFDSNVNVQGLVVTGATDNDVTWVSRSATGSPNTFTARTATLTNALFTVPNSSATARSFGAGRFFVVGVGQTADAGGACLGSITPAVENCSTSLDTTPLGGQPAGVSAVGATEAAIATPGFATVKKVAVLGPTGRGAPLRVYTPPNAVGKMAYGDDGSIYAINTTRAEIMILAPNGGISTLALSTASASSPEYQAMLPRSIFNIPGKNELFLIVQGNPIAGGTTNQFFRIRKP